MRKWVKEGFTWKSWVYMFWTPFGHLAQPWIQLFTSYIKNRLLYTLLSRGFQPLNDPCKIEQQFFFKILLETMTDKCATVEFFMSSIPFGNLAQAWIQLYGKNLLVLTL